MISTTLARTSHRLAKLSIQNTYVCPNHGTDIITKNVLIQLNAVHYTDFRL